MTEDENNLLDVAPGSPHDNIVSEVTAYVIGLGLALLMTGVSFWVASTSVLWGPGVAVGLVVLAIAQIGIHLVFFLHVTSGPDNTNNVLALAFGALILVAWFGKETRGRDLRDLDPDGHTFAATGI